MHTNTHPEKRTFLGMEAVIASSAVRELLATVERVARTDASVLITGESGTGKELVARAIHHYSRRAHRPWIDLSCAALPEHLVESELFGYDRGAFSGAETSKPGLFELAHTGSIFLDEIGELAPRMQVKLLRVLDAVPYFRLGGIRKISVDTRVIAATNTNLDTAVGGGAFRSDLYHRLGQFTLHVPPLRERIEDVAPLAAHFLAQHNPELTLSPGAIEWLESQAWPGNIRELRNTVIKAAVLAKSTELHAEDFPRPLGQESAYRMATPGLEALEKETILSTLRATGGHQSRAAERLGISRRTLSRKLKIYETGPAALKRVEALQ
ncbi:MAG: sigma-54 dependent transcriptional regulator [Bryobacteraceae bacterium]